MYRGEGWIRAEGEITAPLMSSHGPALVRQLPPSRGARGLGSLGLSAKSVLAHEPHYTPGSTTTAMSYDSRDGDDRGCPVKRDADSGETGTVEGPGLARRWGVCRAPPEQEEVEQSAQKP